MRKKALAFSIATGFAIEIIQTSAAHAKYFFNFQSPVTPIAHDFLFIHDLFLAIIVVIFAIALGVLLYSIWNHSKSRNPTPAKFSDPKTAKHWILSAIPILLLIFIDYVVLGIPSLNSIMALANTRNDKLVVVVTGSQWKWNYAYPKYGVHFTSALSTPNKEIYGNAPKDKHFLLEVNKPLVLPTHEKILIILKSADVIHGFWVPSFGIKVDAIPGYLRKTWIKVEKPGIYRGQCSELCGVGHGFMPIVVDAKPQSEFKTWLVSERSEQKLAKKAAHQTWTKTALMQRGQQVFQHNCAACHQPTGLGIPGTFPPIATGHPFTAAETMLAKLTKLGFYRSGKIVEGPVANHIHIVLHGISGTPMPPFGPQLNDADIASVITYERNAFGNKTNDVIQPSQVESARGTKAK